MKFALLPQMILLLLILLLMTACSTTVKNRIPANLPATQAAAPFQEYRIQTGDIFDIKFFYNPELNELGVTVRPDGRISLQLANDVLVAGLTPAELTDLLKSRYAKDIDKPELTVILRTFSSQRVFVDGEVYKAGLFPLTQSMTVMQSISQAGGLKDSARPDEVIIIRRGAGPLPITMVVNLDQALDNTDMSQDLLLKANDIVFVPKSTIANVNVWVDQYIRRNIPIPIGINAYAGGL